MICKSSLSPLDGIGRNDFEKVSAADSHFSLRDLIEISMSKSVPRYLNVLSKVIDFNVCSYIYHHVLSKPSHVICALHIYICLKDYST